MSTQTASIIASREELEIQEKEKLAPYAVTNIDSRGRVYPESKDPYRLDFQRDRDRVIHCQAFRRLKDKTQVFIPRFDDHVRNRLTHTLEVAHVSRDIARNLKLNEDLAETIALAHDLGHTPFGHAGEEMLYSLMQQFDMTFEHNQQSKRIVESLEKYYPDFRGLNLSHEVLEGLDKHRVGADKNLSLEAQVVNLADEIAYQNHDIEDGLVADILRLEDLKQTRLWVMAEEGVREGLPLKMHLRAVVNNLTKTMIKDIYAQTEANLQQAKIQTLDDVYDSDETFVTFSPTMGEMNRELKEFLFQKLYFHPTIKKQSDRGQKIIEFLFQLYLENPPEKVLNLQKELNEPLVVVVKDYIAGMTDAFAEKQFYSNK